MSAQEMEAARKLRTYELGKRFRDVGAYIVSRVNFMPTSPNLSQLIGLGYSNHSVKTSLAQSGTSVIKAFRYREIATIIHYITSFR
jgi:hypothetical protein